jgi:hypothetical protein
MIYDWMFDNISSSTKLQKEILVRILLLLHRVRQDKVSAMEVWMNLV